MAVILCVFTTVQTAEDYYKKKNDSVRRIPWTPSTAKSFGTRITALDVSTKAKQGITAKIETKSA